jgi:hypothetical protein
VALNGLESGEPFWKTGFLRKMQAFPAALSVMQLAFRPGPPPPGVGEGEGLGLTEGRGVGVAVGVGVGVAVGLGLGLTDGLGVGVGVGVGLTEGLGVGVTEGRGVGVGGSENAEKVAADFRVVFASQAMSRPTAAKSSARRPNCVDWNPILSPDTQDA